MRITTPGVPDTMERKRLGQFFTGTRLAQALAALADASSARSIIDPMSGTGDMLIGCSESGARPTRVGAIEIDPAAAAACCSRTERFGKAIHIETGSAFDPDSWVALPGGWDLVITNPPYVRYQTGSSAASGRVSVPAAETIRHGLVRVISASTTLSDKELSAFRAAAENYSGLSDLAVPSWLLCAAKVKLGGRLALVVPDTWLSRDYAVPVVYVLRRFFEIECVVIDEDAAWFEDALVRTTLVVARRVEEKGSAIGKSGHLVIQVPASAGDETSCVGRVFPAKDANLAFADWVVERRQTKEPSTQPLVSDWSDELDLVGGLIVAAERRTWIALSAEDAFSQQLHRLPGRVRAVLPQNFRASFADLAGLGWATGQGLRSGANDFFYVKIQLDGTYRSALLPDEDLTLPADVVRPAVRRQADLPTDGGRVVMDPSWAVLILDGWALPEDIAKCGTSTGWQCMEGDLARLVRTATETSYSRAESEVSLPELSAVRTNVRFARGTDNPQRFWYHLPPLASRHVPYVYIARVNSHTPVPYLNECQRLVVDANFSTLWPDTAAPTALATAGIIALLSSTWAQALLEATATVMGGGALKVEATHIRRLALPTPDPAQATELEGLGQQLVSTGGSDKVVDAIDRTMTQMLFPAFPAANSALRDLAAALRTKRTPRSTANETQESS